MEDFEDTVKGVKQLWKASIKDAKANGHRRRMRYPTFNEDSTKEFL